MNRMPSGGVGDDPRQAPRTRQDENFYDAAGLLGPESPPERPRARHSRRGSVAGPPPALMLRGVGSGEVGEEAILADILFRSTTLPSALLTIIVLFLRGSGWGDVGQGCRKTVPACGGSKGPVMKSLDMS